MRQQNICYENTKSQILKRNLVNEDLWVRKGCAWLIFKKVHAISEHIVNIDPKNEYLAVGVQVFLVRFLCELFFAEHFFVSYYRDLI